ncbi:MAG: cyclic nucleotide-binding domain-containing protein [Deltaproteobacteria bacterium]|nr:cyclic nucleotide-binding domain-containing protein [Deltaproteobacteria bacterium]
MIENALPSLLPQGERLHFRGGQVLFYAGHLPTGLFWLQSGDVEFTQPKSKTAHPTLPPHHKKLLGIYHLVEEASHEQTCAAKTDVDVIFLPKILVMNLLEQGIGQINPR